MGSGAGHSALHVGEPACRPTLDASTRRGPRGRPRALDEGTRPRPLVGPHAGHASAPTGGTARRRDRSRSGCVTPSRCRRPRCPSTQPPGPDPPLRSGRWTARGRGQAGPTASGRTSCQVTTRIAGGPAAACRCGGSGETCGGKPRTRTRAIHRRRASLIDATDARDGELSFRPHERAPGAGVTQIPTPRTNASPCRRSATSRQRARLPRSRREPLVARPPRATSRRRAARSRRPVAQRSAHATRARRRARRAPTYELPSRWRRSSASMKASRSPSSTASTLPVS